METKNIDRLLKRLKNSTCAFTTALCAMETLEKEGFERLNLSDGKWNIKEGGKYYINVYDSTVIAFTVGDKIKERKKVSTDNPLIRMAAAHTDFPCLYIKPSPEMVTEGYLKVNTEIYGGAILNTWLDRPLSVAGKISLKTENPFRPEVRIVDFKEKIMTIPNLAIHMNREVNKGTELNRQKEMIPVCGILNEQLNKDGFFMEYIAQKLNTGKESILDFELYVYNCDEPEVIGINREFISSPRLDNITSVEAVLYGITNSRRQDGINVSVIFDNEEIGSRTKQGADSALLGMILEKVFISLGFDREFYLDCVRDGFFVSVDVAHGLHPNYPEKSDPTNKNILNGGMVIKRACTQTYATDSESIATVEMICRNSGISYQKYACRSDGTTGSTLGNYVEKYVPMRCVDIGVPILAMHSAREMMGGSDQSSLEEFIRAFMQ